MKKYFSPEEPASFTSISAFKRQHPEVHNEKELTRLLSSYPSYTLHKLSRRRFTRNRTIVGGINEQIQIDLSDMTKFSRYNDGQKFILCAIDVFSKKAWAIPLPSKQPSAVKSGLQTLFSRMDQLPSKIQTDHGGEFHNREIKQFLDSVGVKHFSTFNEETKASVAERFQRSLKTKLFKWFTFQNTHRYLDVLDKLVDSYNNTFHRSIKTTPSSVDKSNEKEIWSRLYKNLRTSRKPFKYKIGDQVRIASQRMIFRKGYEARWTEEIFRIRDRVKKERIVYFLEDLKQEPIKGSFYEEELQKVEKNDDVFIVEKVLRTRRRGGKTEYFVRWAGYPSSHDSWVDSLVDVNHD